MQLERGCVVRALSGRDEGGFYVVVQTDGGRVLIADGKRRRLESPKAKNPRHLAPTGQTLPEEARSTNKQLRLALRVYNGTEPAASIKGRETTCPKKM